MIHPATLPGFLAVLAEQRVPELDKTESASWLPTGPVRLFRWGAVADADGAMMVVSKAARTAEGNMPRGKIAELMAADPAALTPLLPPFGAVAVHDQQAVMVADSMGFQHMFLTSPISDLPPALSNSSLTLGRTTGAAIDLKGVAVQSLLGWQLGQRTLFAGIEKLAPGAVVRLTGAGVGISEPTRCHFRDMSLEVAVQRTAAILRRSLNALIDEHPDAVLQLTGGMDSRLLLSAIPESRRRGLRAMTLEVPGSDDVAIARAIARRYGIRHDVHGLSEVGTLSPAEAWDLCVADAVRLDAMSDPVALAAQRVAERAFDQGVRISGLGGEIARGFYYFGRVRDRTYTRTDSKRLASWRMCVNDAVEPELFTTDFSAWSREITYEEVHNALLGGGPEWFRATDHLYVRHRMQRWAGATDGAVSDQRTVVNPMLDAGFLDIVARLPPAKKTRSKFLAALQLELDPELGRLPLDGRPAPEFYAAQAAINAAARELHLPTVRAEAERLAELAVRERQTHRGYLAEVLAAEVDDRTERRRTRRINEAKFPRIKRLAEFNIDAVPSITPATLAHLTAGNYLDAGEPVVILGDSGTGKTHLLIGLGLAACEQGRRVRYVTTAHLVNELVEAADERVLSRVVARYGRLDLLCLDELGYVQIDPRGAELLFQIITEREERASIAIATNLPFSEWGAVFPDPRLVAAIVDRVTFNAHILETGTQSYRLRTSKNTRRTS